MSCCRDTFIDIDTSIHSSVRFGDDSRVPIDGFGTFLFEGKIGQHIPLTGVYFIPKMTSNIVSLGQLEEGGCDVRMKDGVLRVCDDHDHVIIRVRRTVDQLYLL
jgi:hypothetical protein